MIYRHKNPRTLKTISGRIEINIVERIVLCIESLCMFVGKACNCEVEEACRLPVRVLKSPV